MALGRIEDGLPKQPDSPTQRTGERITNRRAAAITGAVYLGQQ